MTTRALAAAALVVGVVAGCSSHPSKEPGQALYRWATCMGKHGIDLPTPTRDTHGDLVITGDGVRISLRGEPSFGHHTKDEVRSATEACGPPPLLSKGVASPRTIQATKRRFLRFSRCMRAHGLPRYPDPDLSNMESPIPASDDFSPRARAAATACQPILGSPRKITTQ
jgi:hypothetical protein